MAAAGHHLHRPRLPARRHHRQTGAHRRAPRGSRLTRLFPLHCRHSLPHRRAAARHHRPGKTAHRRPARLLPARAGIHPAAAAQIPHHLQRVRRAKPSGQHQRRDRQLQQIPLRQTVLLRLRHHQGAGLHHPGAAAPLLLPQRQKTHHELARSLPAETARNHPGRLVRSRYPDWQLHPRQNQRNPRRLAADLHPAAHLQPAIQPAAQLHGWPLRADSLHRRDHRHHPGAGRRLHAIRPLQRFLLGFRPVFRGADSGRQRHRAADFLRSSEHPSGRHHHRRADFRRSVGLLGHLLRHSAGDGGQGGNGSLAPLSAKRRR